MEIVDKRQPEVHSLLVLEGDKTIEQFLSIISKCHNKLYVSIMLLSWANKESQEVT